VTDVDATIRALPRVTAVVVAFGNEATLPESVQALLGSIGVSSDVVVVHNGCTDGGVETIRRWSGVQLIEPGKNLGFAEGCNVGAAEAHGDHVAFVNPDAVVQPDMLARLAEIAADPTVGIASASLRLAEDPERINSAGNPVHFLGFSWCGGLGDQAADHTDSHDVASASGAAMLVRREVWDTIGGFAPEYFAYYEDTELSLRCWQRGLRVVFEPAAIVTHRYEVSRHDRKLYLVERNRLIGVLTLY
jgi:GT2 family glycosyltransferase